MGIPKLDLPKYAAPLLNLANQYAQGTRPKVVGQMSELIQEFPGGDFEDWDTWYRQRMPTAIEDATNRIAAMVKAFREVLQGINTDDIRRWVEDLVIYKTYQGMCFQDAILQRMAMEVGTSWKRASPEEEAQGVDGYVGDTPVSIKPHTYESKEALREHINGLIVTYKKTGDGIEFEFDPQDLV